MASDRARRLIEAVRARREAGGARIPSDSGVVTQPSLPVQAPAPSQPFGQVPPPRELSPLQQVTKGAAGAVSDIALSFSPVDVPRLFDGPPLSQQLNPVDEETSLRTPPIVQFLGGKAGEALGGATAEAPVQFGPQAFETLPSFQDPQDFEAIMGTLRPEAGERPPDPVAFAAQEIADPAREVVIDPFVNIGSGLAQVAGEDPDFERFGRSLGELGTMAALPTVARGIGRAARPFLPAAETVRASLPTFARAAEAVRGAPRAAARGAVAGEAAAAAAERPPVAAPAVDPFAQAVDASLVPRLPPSAAEGSLAFDRAGTPSLRSPSTPVDPFQGRAQAAPPPEPLALPPASSEAITQGGLINRSRTPEAFSGFQRGTSLRRFEEQPVTLPGTETPSIGSRFGFDRPALSREGVGDIRRPQAGALTEAQLAETIANTFDDPAVIAETLGTADPIPTVLFQEIEQAVARARPGNQVSIEGLFDDTGGPPPPDPFQNLEPPVPVSAPVAESVLREQGKKRGRGRKKKPDKGKKGKEDVESEGAPLDPHIGEPLDPSHLLAPGTKGLIQGGAAMTFQPQFGSFFDKSGLVDSVLRAESKKRRTSNVLAEEMYGPGGLDARAAEMARISKLFKENPQAINVPRKLRQKEPLNDFEIQFLRERGPEFMPQAEALFRQLDRARAEGKSFGDLGPNFYPWNFRSYGSLIRSMGENWREALGNAGAKERLLGHLERSREAIHAPSTDLVSTASAYHADLAAWDSTRPLNKALIEMEASYGARKKGAEAALVKQWNDANLVQAASSLDRVAVELQLRKILEDPLIVGEVFESTGREGFPAGQIKILSRASRAGTPEHFNLELDGNPLPGRFTDLDVRAAKYGDLPIKTKPLTDVVNRITRLGARLALWGRWAPGTKALVSNLSRVVPNEAWGNLRVGFLEAMRRRKSATKLQEWGEQGVDPVDPLSALTDVEAPGSGALSAFDKAGFASMHVPDVLARRIAYESRAAGLRKSHPDWPEVKVRDIATKHAAMVSDMMIAATKAPLMANPFLRFFYMFRNPVLREWQLFDSNLRAGRWKEAGGQIAIRGTLLAALVKAGGGVIEDFYRAMLEVIPVADVFTHEDFLDVPAVTIPVAVAQKLGTAIKERDPGKLIESTSLGRDINRQRINPFVRQTPKQIKDSRLVPVNRKERKKTRRPRR